MPHIDFTKHPTADVIQKTIANAKKDNADLVYQKILSIVEINKMNSANWVNLFVKVKIINAVFNTGILSSRKYADYIFKNVKNIDARLVKGDRSLVKEIATFKIEKKEDGSMVVRNNYSFATYPLYQPHLCFKSKAMDICFHGNKRNKFVSNYADTYFSLQVKQTNCSSLL